MWSGLTLDPSLFTSPHLSFRISYKIASCSDALFLCTKTFCLVLFFVKYVACLKCCSNIFMQNSETICVLYELRCKCTFYPQPVRAFRVLFSPMVAG